MPTEFPIIKTQRLLLRQFVESDLHSVFKGLSHPDVIKYYGVSYKTPEELLQLYKQSTAQDNILILDLPPDRSGRLREKDIQLVLALRKLILKEKS